MFCNHSVIISVNSLHCNHSVIISVNSLHCNNGIFAEHITDSYYEMFISIAGEHGYYNALEIFNNSFQRVKLSCEAL